MDLKLIVLRTGDVTKLMEFYSMLGLKFEYHKHGDSPYHYSAKIDKTTLEIYPLAKGQPSADKHLRLGFSVDHFEQIEKLLEGSINSGALQTEWGHMLIARDPDGRKIEIYKDAEH